MPTNQSNRSQERLAIDGGTPIITRELNRYKGAAAIGEEEKRALAREIRSLRERIAQLESQPVLVPAGHMDKE